jgi:hypothetical protein
MVEALVSLSCGPPPLDLAALPVATVLLSAGVVMPSFGRLDRNRLVDAELSPYPSVASAANSNTRVPPLIRPYPPRLHTLLKIHAPSPKWECIMVVLSLEETYRTGRAGYLGAIVALKMIINALRTWLSRQLLIARIALSALLTPYRAKPGTATRFPAPTTGR